MTNKDETINLPLDTLIGRALVKSGYNLSQMQTTIYKFYDKYDDKHLLDNMNIIFSKNEAIYYALNRGTVLYRYFGINYPKVRPYIRELETKKISGD